MVVRFFHTSDWHLGRLLYGKSLLEDQAFALARLLELIDEKKPDALVISGDIFDRSTPPEAAVQLFDWFCHEAVLKRGLKTFVIPGNHDSADRLGFGSDLLRSAGLVIFSKVEDSLKPVQLKSKDGVETLVYGIPFLEPAIIARFLEKPELRTVDEVTRALIARMAPPPGSLLLCHAFVVGGEASESERDLFVGGSSTVSVDAFGEFAYVALGHLHKPQAAGAPHVRYSGSLLAYSKSEVDHSKSISFVSLGESLDVSFLPLPVRRPLRYVEGTLEDLLRGSGADDYVIVGLTDSGPVLDALARLRAVFPNILHVARAGGYMPSQLPSLERARERESMSDLELFAEFFGEVTAAEMTAEERTALIEALGTLG